MYKISLKTISLMAVFIIAMASCEEPEEEFQQSVRPDTLEIIDKELYEQTFYEGDTIDFKKLIFKCTYTDGSQAEGNMAQLSNQELKFILQKEANEIDFQEDSTYVLKNYYESIRILYEISYDGYIDSSPLLVINTNEVKPIKMELLASPNKLFYYGDEAIDLTGLSYRVIFNNQDTIIADKDTKDFKYCQIHLYPNHKEAYPKDRENIGIYCKDIEGRYINWIEIFIPIHKDVVIDVEGNVYKTVELNTQLWMNENLRVTKYNDSIDITTNNYKQAKADGPNYFYKDICYNWEVVNSNKLCPEGWHVASKKEWESIVIVYGDLPDERTLNRDINDEPILFKNVESPTKYRNYNIWWTSNLSTEDKNKAICLQEVYKRNGEDEPEQGEINILHEPKGSKYPVRCVKDNSNKIVDNF